MDLVINKSIDIPPIFKTNSKSNADSQTLPIQQKEASTMPIEQTHIETQTEKRIDKPSSATRHIRIHLGVLERLLAELIKCEQEREIFAELDAFHQNQAVQLVEFRRITNESVEVVPISGLVCGKERRIAILCGEQHHHEMWCLHTGKVLVIERQQKNWIYLGSCSTSAVFTSQGQASVFNLIDFLFDFS